MKLTRELEDKLRSMMAEIEDKNTINQKALDRFDRFLIKLRVFDMDVKNYEIVSRAYHCVSQRDRDIFYGRLGACGDNGAIDYYDAGQEKGC